MSTLGNGTRTRHEATMGCAGVEIMGGVTSRVQVIGYRFIRRYILITEIEEETIWIKTLRLGLIVWMVMYIWTGFAGVSGWGEEAAMGLWLLLWMAGTVMTAGSIYMDERELGNRYGRDTFPTSGGDLVAWLITYVSPLNLLTMLPFTLMYLRERWSKLDELDERGEPVVTMDDPPKPEPYP